MIDVAYHRVYNILREGIMDHTLKAGEKIPPERILCENYGVSRITIRHALRLLQDQGLIERMPGRGTFVRSPKPKKVPILEYDYVKSLANSAPGIERQLITSEEICPPEEISQVFGLLKSQTCLLIERLDFLKEGPLSFDRGYIPLEYTRSITDEILCSVDFLNTWIKNEGLEISHVQAATEAIEADKITADTLALALHSPVLLTSETFYAKNGKPLAVFITSYRGDSFRLVSTFNLNS
jgi:GntR family transcriptional regulator